MSKTKSKIRIGLLLDDFETPNWMFSMIEEIQNNDNLEIILVVKNGDKRKNSFSLSKLWKEKSRFFYHFYYKIDKLIFKEAYDAFERVNINSIIDCDIIEVRPKKNGNSTFFSNRDIEHIDRFHLDVIVKLGFDNLKGEILNSAKYGVWAYSNRRLNGGIDIPIGSIEVLERSEMSTISLNVLSKSSNDEIVLYLSHSATDILSINRNRNKLYWKAKSFVVRRLIELQEIGGEHFIGKYKKENKELILYFESFYSIPGNVKFIKMMTINYWNYIGRKLYNLLYIEKWILLFNFTENREMSVSFNGFKSIIPPKDRFWADPFVLYKNDKHFVFFEEFVYSEKKGKISVMEIDKNGDYSQPIVIIEKPYHLSYPFVFESKGKYYMIPESSHNRTVELYECEEFPLTWKFKKVLIDNILALDTTLLIHNNKYWLFINVKENLNATKHDELFLFYTDDLLNGKFESHRNNPIISDARNARPAGSIIFNNGKFYRTSQDCVPFYGQGIQLNEIIELSEKRYRERNIQTIRPEWRDNLKGIHTLNHEQNITVIDGLLRQRRYFL